MGFCYFSCLCYLLFTVNFFFHLLPMGSANKINKELNENYFIRFIAQTAMNPATVADKVTSMQKCEASSKYFLSLKTKPTLAKNCTACSNTSHV